MSAAGDFAEGFGVVEIQDTSLFVGGNFADFFWVRPNYCARAFFLGSVEQFFVQARGKNHWMTASALIEGKNDGGTRFLECVNQFGDKRFADEGVVHGAKKDSVRVGRQAANGGLNRT